MTLSPEMIKILGSIASSAMSSKGKEESKPQPKLNANFLIDADKQASPLNSKLFNKIGSSVSNIFKPGKNKQTRLANRNQRRLDRAKRVDTDPATGKYVKGSGAGGTDVGNFFRRMKNPAAPQNPPKSSTNTGTTNYDNKKEEAKTYTELNTNWNIDGSYSPYRTPGYMGLDHKTISLLPEDSPFRKNTKLQNNKK